MLNLHKYWEVFVGHDYTIKCSHLDSFIMLILIILTLACVNKQSCSYAGPNRYSDILNNRIMINC